MRPRPAAAAVLIALLSPSAGAATLPAPATDVRTGDRVQLEPRAALTHLVFFATWCPPCLDEIAPLAELHATWSARGYRLVLVGVDRRQTRERLAAFLEEERPPGELVYDQGGPLSRAFGIDRLPAHVVLDAAGQVVARSTTLSADLLSDVRARLSAAPLRSP